MRTDPGSGNELFSAWDGTAARARTTNLNIGLGPSVNGSSSTLAFGYYIKDVFITFTDNTTQDATAKTATTVRNHWRNQNAATWSNLISEFRPLVE